MRKTLLLTPALLAVLSFPAPGADSTWISTANPLWSVAGNWSAGNPGIANGLGAIFQDSSTIGHAIDIGGGSSYTRGIVFGAFTGGAGFSINSAGAGTLYLDSTGTFAGVQNNEAATQTISVPMQIAGQSGSASATSQSFDAAAGNLVFSGTNLNTHTLVLNGGTLTVDGAFNTTIGIATGRGDITGIAGGTGPGNLVKSGTGTLTLGGTVANAYTGTTTVNAGTIQAGKVNAFGTGQLLLNGGTVNTGDYNQSFGTLNLQGNATLDLSPTGTNSLTFSDSHSINWASGAVLTIDGWTSGDTLRFGSSGSALTAGQLSQIYFNITGDTQASIDPATGFITPVPEPSTLAFCIVGGFGLALAITSRRRKS